MNSSSSANPTITNPISNVLGSTTTKTASSVIGSTTSTTGSFFSNMSWTKIILLFLFFFFFGFGIFVYLAKGTESAIEFTSNIFVSTLQKIMNLFGNDSVDFSTEEDTNATTDEEDDSNIEKHMEDDHGVPGKPETQANTASANSSEMPRDTTREDNLDKALSNAKPNLTHKNEPGYNADDSYSTIQMSKSSSKSGWCFIGEDRGFRSCIKVGQNDTCMSGDIFPSQEICINPSLRS